mmetsp:Transcript_1313/g.3217  ORF Transcript_1313/g.3217 Transcript_1313/m.3217 type:complete len:208 (-) Transcript_1313:303-926(-)
MLIRWISSPRIHASFLLVFIIDAVDGTTLPSAGMHYSDVSNRAVSNCCCASGILVPKQTTMPSSFFLLGKTRQRGCSWSMNLHRFLLRLSPCCIHVVARWSGGGMLNSLDGPCFSGFCSSIRYRRVAHSLDGWGFVNAILSSVALRYYLPNVETILNAREHSIVKPLKILLRIMQSLLLVMFSVNDMSNKVCVCRGERCPRTPLPAE